jgi:hypothetical protein
MQYMSTPITDATAADLQAAAEFFAKSENRDRFPAGRYAEPAEVTYWVDSDGDDPAADFDARALRVLEAGGAVIDRPFQNGNTIQHIATLEFGSGRVRYRVVWMEHLKSDEPEKED